MLLRKRIFGVLFLLWLASSEVQGAITQGPSNVTYFPGDPDIRLTCTVTSGVPAWIINGTVVLLTQLDNPANFPNVPPGHSRIGSDIIIEAPPANSTVYVCLVEVSLNESFQSDPAFVYVAAPPDMVGDINIDIPSVNIDNDNISFTLSWNEPFANFDPIVNYTVNITCTDNATQCPAVFSVTTTSAFVHFITDLSVMTTLSVTATNNVGESQPGMIVIVVPGNVSMVEVECEAVDVINQCTVTWNAPPNVTGTVAAPIYYNVSYSGENIEEGYQRVEMPMATINFTVDNSNIDYDSDVNVTVTAMNAFGSGSTSDIEMDQIVGRSVIGIKSMISDSDDLMNTYSVVVECEINPTASAGYVEVIARNDSAGLNPETNRVAIVDPENTSTITVTVGGLVCNKNIYEIVAGGTDGDDNLVGPRFQGEMVTAGLCPTPTPDISSSMSTNVASTTMIVMPPMPPRPTNDMLTDDEDNTGAIVGGVVGGICGAILIIVLIILLWFCCIKKRGEKSSRATSPGGEKGGAGVKVHTLDRYGKPIPLEGENTDTGVELTGYTAKSPEFTVSQVPSTAPATTFQGNDYQTDEKNRVASTYGPEGSYDTLAPAEEPTAPSAEVVPPSQNGQSNPNAPKLNYADLEQFTRKPASVKKPEPQPASQYAVIDPKSLQQGTYT